MASHSNAPVIVVGGNTPAQNSASPSGSRSLKQRLFNVENLTQAVLWVGIISLVAVVVTVSAMVLDQMHFNNQTYRDQSDKASAEYQELNARLDILQNQINDQKSQTTVSP
jgi:hypothetical protein